MCHVSRAKKFLHSTPFLSMSKPHPQPLLSRSAARQTCPSSLQLGLFTRPEVTCSETSKKTRYMLICNGYDVSIPGTQMTLVLVGKDLVLEGLSPKIEDKQVPGI